MRFHQRLIVVSMIPCITGCSPDRGSGERQRAAPTAPSVATPPPEPETPAAAPGDGSQSTSLVLPNGATLEMPDAHSVMLGDDLTSTPSSTSPLETDPVLEPVPIRQEPVVPAVVR